MGSFADPHISTDWVRPGTYKLTKAVVYTTDSGEVIRAKKGLVFDWASIPKPLQAVYSKDGAWAPAAVIHDHLYGNRIGTRKRADDIFLEAMKSLGVPWLRRNLFYLAVRAFGGFQWRDDD